jgi:hypothetical protein
VNREVWRNADATATRLYCTTVVQTYAASGALNNDDDTVVSQAALTASAPYPNAGMEGRFRSLCLHVDLARGLVTGEGVHATVGEFFVEGSVEGHGFSTTTTLQVTLHWKDGRYHPLQLKLSAPPNW